MTDMNVVTINGTNYTIQRFRALRAVLVLASITRITQDVPDLIAKASKSYSARNTVTITEQMSKLPRWEGFSSADFDIAEQKTGKREIELPSQANGTEALLEALPELLQSTARREVVRLFAILLIPNDELRIADKNDLVNEALDKYEDLILFEAELDELADIAAVAQESIKDLDTRRNGKVGKLAQRVLTALNPELSQRLTQSASEPVIESSETSSTEPTSVPDVPTSSTPSELPTDGTETPRSLASLGAS